MRFLTLLLVLLGAFALCACDNGTTADSSGGSSSSGGGGGGGGGGGAQTGNTATSAESSLAQQVLALVNQERANAGTGLSPLTWNSSCAQVAYDHSWDMDYRDFWDTAVPNAHTNPDGDDPFDRMSYAGISYSAAGENIAAGYPTAAAVMTGWMNSPGHRANILNANFTEIGIGVRQGTIGTYGTYWTQIFRRP